MDNVEAELKYFLPQTLNLKVINCAYMHTCKFVLLFALFIFRIIYIPSCLVGGNEGMLLSVRTDLINPSQKCLCCRIYFQFLPGINVIEQYPSPQTVPRFCSLLVTRYWFYQM